MAAYFKPKDMEIIQGTPTCMEFFRSRAPTDEIRKSLFLYRHHTSKRFILGQWITKMGVFIPILEIGSSLDDFGRDTCKRYMDLMYPEKAPQLVDGLKQAARNQEDMDEALLHDRIENKAKILKDEFGVSVHRENGTVLLPSDVATQ